MAEVSFLRFFSIREFRNFHGGTIQTQLVEA